LAEIERRDAAAPQKEVAPAKLVGEGKEFPLRLGRIRWVANRTTTFPSRAFVTGKHANIEVTEQESSLPISAAQTNLVTTRTRPTSERRFHPKT